MDKIYVNQMMFYGYHGVFEEEKKLGQRFYVDVVIDINLQEAGVSGDLQKTINYKEIYDIARDIVEGPSQDLIESVGEKIASALLLRYHAILHCKITVTKPDPPIQGYYSSVAVEINRSRHVEK